MVSRNLISNTSGIDLWSPIDMKKISESQRKVDKVEIARLTEQNEKTSAQILELTKQETVLLEKVGVFERCVSDRLLQLGKRFEFLLFIILSP